MLRGVVAAGFQVPDDVSVGVVEVSGEAVSVDEGVVASAQECGIGQVGGSAVEPVEEVVSVAPGRRGGAAGVGAVPVAEDERGALSAGEVAGPAAQGQVAAGGPEEEPERAVAARVFR